MAALKGINTEGIIKFLLFGLVAVFAVTTIIDFGAISADKVCSGGGHTTEATCEAAGFNWAAPDIFIPPDETSIVGIFAMLIMSIAVWITWKVTGILEGRLDRKKLITLVIMGVVLYFVYTSILQPILCNNVDPCPLPELFQSAASLKMALVP